MTVVVVDDVMMIAPIQSSNKGTGSEMRRYWIVGTCFEKVSNGMAAFSVASMQWRSSSLKSHESAHANLAKSKVGQ